MQEPAAMSEGPSPKRLKIQSQVTEDNLQPATGAKEQYQDDPKQNAMQQQQQQQQQLLAVQEQKPKRKKKKRSDTPAMMLMVSVQNAAKSNDPAAGIAAYHKAKAEGISIKPDLYSILLYLCAGGNDWELPLRQELVESTPLVQEIMQMAAATEAAEAAEAEATAEAALATAVDDHPPNPYLSSGVPKTAVDNQPANPNLSSGVRKTAVDNQPANPYLSSGVHKTAGLASATPFDAANTPGSDAGPSATTSKDHTTTPTPLPSNHVAAANGSVTSEVRSAVTDESQASTDAPEQSNVAVTVMSPAELHTAGRAIFDDMQSGESKPLELAYTALARMAAAAGNGDAALEVTQQGLKAGVPARLRAFVPALLAYAVAGEATKAFQVADCLAELKLDLTELEFALLLQACARGNASWQSVQGLLSRMTNELVGLQPETLAAAEQYFRSESAKEAAQGKGKGSWVLEPCTVSQSGHTSNCGAQLQALDLTEEELETFAEGIAQMAASRERYPNDFETFKGWLEQHGPFHALVDGANVAFYGQNYCEGAFNFTQIRRVMSLLESKHPDLKPLMMLHVSRTRGPPANGRAGRSLLADLTHRNAFYATPKGSNDDWYWMYAAVKAGPTGLLISNDQMRDHLFQLLAPKFFHKWRQRHQVNYTFGSSGLHLQYPAEYTVCTQGLSSGSFVFPAPDGKAWLSARLQ